MIAHFVSRAAAVLVALAISALCTTGCTSPPVPTPYPSPYPPPARQPAEPEELFPQRGDVPGVSTKGKNPTCTDKDARLVLVIGNQPRTIERMGIRVTTTRTDDGVRISLIPYNDTLVAGVVDDLEVISLDDGDGGLYDDVTLRNDRFAPLDKQGDTDTEYVVRQVVLCNGGA